MAEVGSISSIIQRDLHFSGKTAFITVKLLILVYKAFLQYVKNKVDSMSRLHFTSSFIYFEYVFSEALKKLK